MKKIEILWREILFNAIEKKIFQFKQTDLASKFKFSLSTVFQSLKPLRKMGAIKVGGRGFEVVDFEKILYYWASVRDFKKEIIYQTFIDKNPLEIEGEMPPEIIYGFYSAYRLKFNGAPADYDRVLVYLGEKEKETLAQIKERFPENKGRANLFILKGDKRLASYGQTTTVAHTFVDLWNEETWYSKEFIKSLIEKYVP